MSQTIVATILSGGSRENEICDAVRSVLFVDHICLIDTGESAQEAIRRVLAMPEVAGKVSVHRFPGDFNRCDEGRNFCIDTASAISGDEPSWLMMLDTDERFFAPGIDVHGYLEQTKADVVQVSEELGRYTKERFIRLPARGRYKVDLLDVHEEFAFTDGTREVMQGAWFSEIEKTPEQLESVLRTVEASCRRALAVDPTHARSWLYLGNALAYFERYEEAIEAYLKHAEFAPHDQAWGWAIFRVATCYEALGRYREAVEYCTVGMQRCPFFAEFPWLASLNELAQGGAVHAVNAAAWADMAIILGRTIQHKRARPVRIGFQVPEAEWEAPWQVRRNAFSILGDTEIASQANELAERAEAARIGRNSEKGHE